MSDSDPMASGAANLGETAKWLIGGVAATAVGVLVGSPLTGLGSLDPGPRLLVALGSAATALVLLGVLLWFGVRVVAAETIGVARLAEAKGLDAGTSRRMAKRFEGRLPLEATSFQDLYETSLDLFKRDGNQFADTSAATEARRQAFKAWVDKRKTEMGFEFKRDRFRMLTVVLLVTSPFIAACVGAFAWAANPGGGAGLLDKPQAEVIRLSAAEAVELPTVIPNCYAVSARGEVLIEAVAVAKSDGRTEYVTLPDARVAPCEPVRLARQFGRWFDPT